MAFRNCEQVNQRIQIEQSVMHRSGCHHQDILEQTRLEYSSNSASCLGAVHRAPKIPQFVCFVENEKIEGVGIDLLNVCPGGFVGGDYDRD